jgi:hypothetical protein
MAQRPVAAQQVTNAGKRRVSRRSTYRRAKEKRRRMAMAYGHAERNLALIRQLEAETRQLLYSLTELDPEESAWLQETADRGQ